MERFNYFEQREIKFRAFHKERKEMYNVHGWHSEFVFKDTLDGVGTEGNPDFIENVVLMQFTGLKDKKGVEIYEGDIIDWEGSVGVMVFNGPSWCVKIRRWNVPQRFSLDSLSNIEVIGNIYKNIELLTS